MPKDISRRLLQLVASIVLTVVLISLYFFIQSRVNPCYNFATIVDFWVPFIPWTIWIYMSYALCYVFAALVLESKEFKTLYLKVIVIFFFSIILFIIFPSNYPRADTSSISEFYQWGYGLLYGIDGANNTFPSLHVSLTWVVCFALVDKFKKQKWIIIIYCTIVSLSVLTTKQHFIADILGGLFLVFFTDYLFYCTKYYFIGKASN